MVWNESSLKDLEQGVPSRVWNEVYFQGSGTKCALKGQKQDIQGSGTRFAFKDLKQGVPSRIWNEASPQGSGTRCSLKGLKRGVL